MKLKTYTPDNSGIDRSKKAAPFISVRFDKGLFFFNQAACNLIGLKAGDKVLFHQDEEDPLNWYVEKAETGFDLRTPVNAQKGLMMNKGTVAAAIGSGKGTARLRVAGQPTEIDGRKLWGMLTNGIH